MLIVVVIWNVLLSLALLYLARKILVFKQKLVNITNILTIAERNTSAVLSGAPSAIMMRQQNIRNLRQVHQVVSLQIYQIRQLFGLFLLGMQLWQNIQRNLQFPTVGRYTQSS